MRTLQERLDQLLERDEETRKEWGDPPTPEHLAAAAPTIARIEEITGQPAHLYALGYDCVEISAEWWIDRLNLSYGWWSNGEFLLHALDAKVGTPAVLDEESDLERGLVRLVEVLDLRKGIK